MARRQGFLKSLKNQILKGTATHTGHQDLEVKASVSPASHRDTELPRPWGFLSLAPLTSASLRRGN